MEGRWTIRLDHAGNELAPAQPEPSDQFVPVVPCDDAAIARVATALREAPPFDSFEDLAALALRAAGETP